MNLNEIAEELVSLCRGHNGVAAVERLYATNIVSNEGLGTMGAKQSTGLDDVLAKNRWWYEQHDIHRLDVHGPFFAAAGDEFSVFFDMDVTQAFSGNRVQLSEVAVYRVADGKIVEETFMLNPKQMAA